MKSASSRTGRCWACRCAPISTRYHTAYHNIQTLETLPNVTLATGRSAAGACTQALFNAGQCLGTTNDNVTFNAPKRPRLWRGMGYHRAAHPTG